MVSAKGKQCKQSFVGGGRKQVLGGLIRCLGSAASWHWLWHLPLCDRQLGMVEYPRETLTTSSQEPSSRQKIKIPNNTSLLTPLYDLGNWIFLQKGPV